MMGCRIYFDPSFTGESYAVHTDLYNSDGKDAILFGKLWRTFSGRT